MISNDVPQIAMGVEKGGPFLGDQACCASQLLDYVRRAEEKSLRRLLADARSLNRTDAQG